MRQNRAVRLRLTAWGVRCRAAADSTRSLGASKLSTVLVLVVLEVVEEVVDVTTGDRAYAPIPRSFVHKVSTNIFHFVISCFVLILQLPKPKFDYHHKRIKTTTSKIGNSNLLLEVPVNGNNNIINIGNLK